MTCPSKRSSYPAVPARLFAAPTECPGRRAERVSDGLCAAALAVARNGDPVTAGDGACVIIRWSRRSSRRWSTSIGPLKRCLATPPRSAPLPFGRRLLLLHNEHFKSSPSHGLRVDSLQWIEISVSSLSGSSHFGGSTVTARGYLSVGRHLPRTLDCSSVAPPLLAWGRVRWLSTVTSDCLSRWWRSWSTLTGPSKRSFCLAVPARLFAAPTETRHVG